MALLAYVFLGKIILPRLGIVEPPWLVSIRDNKLILIGGYFAANTIISTLSSSGAYEVSAGNKLIFSKLEAGRVPTILELATAIASSGEIVPDPAAAMKYGLGSLLSSELNPLGATIPAEEELF